jgi:formate dehydrogenase major subunit
MTAGGAGATLTGLGIEHKKAYAEKELRKLDGVDEYTTSCNFCSCGCGMLAHVKEGKLVNLEGDPDHIVSEGALCSKGSAMFETHYSDQRVKKPRYRASGSDHWEEISWEDAINRIAEKIKKVRDENWIATEKDGDAEYAVNRTEAIGFLGGAQNTNEECYLFAKMGRLIGTPYIEHQARL